MLVARGRRTVGGRTTTADEAATSETGEAATGVTGEAAQAVQGAGVDGGADGDRPRVLVVEDDRGLRLALRRALEGLGCEVAAAADAVTAAERFGGVRPHLVVLDLRLPRGDGLDLCRRLRRRPDGQGVAVLMLTARDGVADRVAGRAGGA